MLLRCVLRQGEVKNADTDDTGKQGGDQDPDLGLVDQQFIHECQLTDEDGHGEADTREEPRAQ